jgi:hypothetical protein
METSTERWLPCTLKSISLGLPGAPPRILIERSSTSLTDGGLPPHVLGLLDKLWTLSAEMADGVTGMIIGSAWPAHSRERVVDIETLGASAERGHSDVGGRGTRFVGLDHDTGESPVGVKRVICLAKCPRDKSGELAELLHGAGKVVLGAGAVGTLKTHLLKVVFVRHSRLLDVRVTGRVPALYDSSSAQFPNSRSAIHVSAALADATASSIRQSSRSGGGCCCNGRKAVGAGRGSSRLSSALLGVGRPAAPALHGKPQSSHARPGGLP